MLPSTLQGARQAVVRDRVISGVVDVLERGDDLTFAKVAAAADVPERTVYRHFPTRVALLAAVYDWANERIGIDHRPVDRAEAVTAVRRAFTAFDELAPVVRQLLIAHDGLAARLATNDDRQRAAQAIVEEEAPDLDAVSRRRVAAVIQLLSSATAWQALRDYWQMDGAEAAEASALAIDLLLDAAAGR